MFWDEKTKKRLGFEEVPAVVETPKTGKDNKRGAFDFGFTDAVLVGRMFRWTQGDELFKYYHEGYEAGRKAYSVELTKFQVKFGLLGRE